MNSMRKLLGICFLAIAIAASLHLLGNEAMAAGDTGNWRNTYDLVMRWINFGILAFVLVKFGKKPLKDFLHGQRDELEREIKKIEEEKESITDKIKEIKKLLDESDIRLGKLKERIIAQGEKEKQKIIENAMAQGNIMLEGAKIKIVHRLKQAKNTFRLELIDAACALVIEKLPDEITDKDNQKFIDIYLAGTSAN